LAVSGWIASVSAAQDSLPGDALYGIKLAAEKTEVIVAGVLGSAESQAATSLKHAAVKVTEIHNAKSVKQAAVSIQSLKEKIESTNETLKQAETKSPGKAVAVAKMVEKKTEEILSALSDVKNTDVTAINREASATPPALTKEVAVVEKLIEQTSVKAVAVLVDNKTDAGVVAADVKQTIERKVDRLVSDLVKLDTEVGVANTQLAVSTTAIGVPVASVGATVSTTGLAALVANSSSSTPTDSAILKVHAAGEVVDQATKIGEATAAEVKTLIEQNDLKTAIKKVQELGDVKQQAKEVVSEAKVAVQEVVKDKDAVKPVSIQGKPEIGAAVASSTGASTPVVANTAIGTSTAPTVSQNQPLPSTVNGGQAIQPKLEIRN